MIKSEDIDEGSCWTFVIGKNEVEKASINASVKLKFHTCNS